MNKTKVLAQQLLNGVLIIAVLILLAVLSVRYEVKQDWTAGKRNTLTEASRKQLESMPDPIRFVSFAEQGGEDRDAVKFWVDKYKRFKPDIELDYIDPSAQPKKVREYNVSYAGEVVLEYQGRRESLRGLNEQSITGSLQRLAFTGEQWIVFLQGHGERAIDTVGAQGPTESSFDRYVQVLRDKGLKAQALNLVQSPTIPDNTAVLVIASPQKALLEGEVQLIKQYVDKGGNLLWLADPDNPPGLDAVAQTLGVTWQNGYAIFPEYQMLGTGHPGIFAAIGYPPNPVTQGMDQVTLFPLVRALVGKPANGWTVQPMLTSSDAAWLETGSIDNEAVKLEPEKGDIPGPLNIGLTLSRDVPPAAGAAADAKPRQQRVALIGDADFLSDAYLAQLGNQQLGINLVQWLAARDTQLNIDIPKAPDADLFLPSWTLILITVGFTLLLPLLLLGVGITRWVLRRRR